MKNKKLTYFLCGMFALLTIGGIGACIGSSVVLMDQNNAQFSKVNQFIDDERARQAKEAEQSNTYQEDGYKVMEQYEIRSTRQISDAFLKKDPSGLSQEDKETYDMAKKVYDKIIKDNMNAYEKELAIYDWMVKNIRQGSGYAIIMPGQNTQAYTPHEVLKSRNAVCVGYATTFRLLANMAGLEVHIVHNDSHSWDMVKLDDNEWYHLDIYSDVNGARYRNFNMTDAQTRNGHEWDASALPEAKGTKYSYAVQNAVEIKDVYKIPSIVRKKLDKKQCSLYYKFPKKMDKKMIALVDQMVSLMQQAVYSVPGGESKELSGELIANGEDDFVLAIYIVDYSQNNISTNAADPKKLKKMTDKVNEAFGSALEASGNVGDGEVQECERNIGDM